jgi:GNAT superfamily N-acetyltransferase
MQDKYKRFGMYYMAYLHELAGTFFITRDYGFIEYRIEGNILYVDAFYVVPNKRKTGYGRYLMEEVEIVARGHGCDVMIGYIDTNLPDWTKRRSIFLKLGLEPDWEYSTDVETYVPYRKNL